MFNEIPMNINDGKNGRSQESQQQALHALQEQAYEELERILLDCNSIDAVMLEVSAWQDRFNIIDIDTFFEGNSDLASAAKKLISQKFEELRIKEENEKALSNTLALVSQKKTFLRLYNICSDAKNYKDFDISKDKLKDWLKDHPKSTWEQFSPEYKKYFEKCANEDYLKSATEAPKQEMIMNSLQEIIDYSIQYSNYQYFQENIDKWQQEYFNRDAVLNSENKNKIEELIKEGYEKLAPPDEQPKFNELTFNRSSVISIFNNIYFHFK